MRVVRWVLPFVALATSACTVNVPGLSSLTDALSKSAPKAPALAAPGKSSGGTIDLKVSGASEGGEGTTAPLTSANIAGMIKAGVLGGENTSLVLTALPADGAADGRGLTINGWTPGKATAGTALPVKGFYNPRDPEAPYATVSYGENGLTWHGTGGTVVVSAIAGRAVTLNLKGVAMGPAAAGGAGSGAGTFIFDGAVVITAAEGL